MTKIDNFKLFVKNNPNLITYVRNNTMSWQKFYELYDLYGEDNNVWNEYLNKDTTVNTTKTESKKSNKFSDILDMAKNLDTNKLQDGISSVQKALVPIILDQFTEGLMINDNRITIKNKF